MYRPIDACTAAPKPSIHCAFMAMSIVGLTLPWRARCVTAGTRLSLMEYIDEIANAISQSTAIHSACSPYANVLVRFAEVAQEFTGRTRIYMYVAACCIF